PEFPTFKCHSSEYSDKSSHSTFIDQVSGFGTIAGIIFNVSFYGAISKLSLKTTCIIDDILILTVALTPAFSWFFTAKIASTFSNLDEVTLINKFVFLQLYEESKISKFLDSQRIYIAVDINNEDSMKYVRDIRDFYRQRKFKAIKDVYHCIHYTFYSDQENDHLIIDQDKKDKKDEEKTILEEIITKRLNKPFAKKFLSDKILKFEDNSNFNKVNIPGTRTIAKCLTDKHCSTTKVYVNILEMGLFQYFTYSHRSHETEAVMCQEKIKKIRAKDDEKNEKKEIIVNISDDKKTITVNDFKIDIKTTKVVWFIIPEFPLVINQNSWKKVLKECNELEKLLNQELLNSESEKYDEIREYFEQISVDSEST
ncbi:5028_t:CDS:2, partial [Racocetra persica]